MNRRLFLQSLSAIPGVPKTLGDLFPAAPSEISDQSAFNAVVGDTIILRKPMYAVQRYGDRFGGLTTEMIIDESLKRLRETTRMIPMFHQQCLQTIDKTQKARLGTIKLRRRGLKLVPNWIYT